jgi:putative DNA primase/helicase
MSDNYERLRSAALAYAKRLGWPVFPLTPGTKIPLRGTHGFKDATTGLAVIEAWWRMWPEANIGLDCGGAGLVVIDLDVKGEADGLAAWGELRTRLGFDDRTLTSSTPSGGRHLFFRRPADDRGTQIRNSAGKLGPGIDVRVRGGYVVLPPSAMAEGDYAWEEGAGPGHLAPAPLPPALLSALAVPSGPARISSLQELPGHPARQGQQLAGTGIREGATPATPASLQAELDALSGAAVGQRNDRLNRAAFRLGQLVGGGELARSEVEILLAQRARALGLGAVETHNTIRSGLEAGMAKPLKTPSRHAGGCGTGTQAGRPDGAGISATRDRRTDLGNAERLVARHGEDLRFCYPWGKWLVWDGRRWHLDASGEVVRRATETVGSIYGEAAQANGEQRTALARWGLRSEARARIRDMIHLARSREGIHLSPDELDADPWLLTVYNGTLNLRTGELLPHDRAHLITRLAPVTFDPQAQAPTWTAFLERIMAGNGALIAFLQRVVGYSLAGDNSEQVLFILHGRGANGKSTFLEALGHLLGDYAQKTPAETLVRQRSSRVPNDLARLSGARLVSTVEVEEGQRLAESLVKQLTGGDRIAARFLYGEYFEFLPRFKLFLATNHKPQIRGTDPAIWRRIRLVPFDVSIPEAEQDRKLGHKLRAELPGILAWALEGCLTWRCHGLGTPPEVRQATEGYRGEMDPLAGFFEECCVERPAAQTTVKALYEAYTRWCEANGERPLSKRALGSRLRERGCEQRKGAKGARYWQGIGLLGEPEQLDLIQTRRQRSVLKL